MAPVAAGPEQGGNIDRGSLPAPEGKVSRFANKHYNAGLSAGRPTLGVGASLDTLVLQGFKILQA